MKILCQLVVFGLDSIYFLPPLKCITCFCLCLIFWVSPSHTVCMHNCNQSSARTYLAFVVSFVWYCCYREREQALKCCYLIHILLAHCRHHRRGCCCCCGCHAYTHRETVCFDVMCADVVVVWLVGTIASSDLNTWTNTGGIVHTHTHNCLSMCTTNGWTPLFDF